MRLRPAHLIDFYKSGHLYQYPDKVERVVSNMTPRMSRIPNVDKVVMFGLQYVIKEYFVKQFNEEFFDIPWRIIESEYQRRMDGALGEGAVGIDHIKELHSIGYLPIKVMALAEGSRVDLRVPMFIIYNTDKRFGWLTNYLETLISTSFWGMATSATMALEYKMILNEYADRTVGDRDFVKFQGHDFSMRGMMGVEAACMSGAAHLTSFVGTDTVPAIDFLEDYYGANSDDELVGCSVPATEHAVMCLHGDDDEYATFKDLITKTYPNGVVSIVSDTWDFWRVITEFMPHMQGDIMKRDGKVVIRPDSGDPADIICGTVEIGSVNADYVHNPEELGVWAADGIRDEIECDTPHGECGETEVTRYYRFDNKVWEVEVSIEWNRYDKQYYFIEDVTVVKCGVATLSAEQKGAIECLWETFGGSIYEKGYKELDSHIGLIYGDSITLDRCKDICARLEAKGFASTNVVFGIGSYTYQYTTRDTYGFAIKATYAEVDGEPREIFKKPKTDNGMKNSAKGLTAVYDIDNDYELVDQATWDQVHNCDLQTVFENGTEYNTQTLDDVRQTILRSS